MEKLYRYDSWYTACLDPSRLTGTLKVNLEEDSFNIIKRTPCGVWIDMYCGKRKFVNLKCNKKWAYETEEDALKGFIARKSRQMTILTNQLEHAKIAKDLAQKQLSGQ